jgi:hypothetical protein
VAVRLRRLAVLAVAAVVAVAAPGVGHGQPGRAPSDVLRDGNTAALAGDWQRVADLVDPLLREQLPVADLAEAHRLAGIAAFFAQRAASAEQHFVTYLRIEPDGRLDPALSRSSTTSRRVTPASSARCASGRNGHRGCSP